jgi:hypothetical protein
VGLLVLSYSPYYQCSYSAKPTLNLITKAVIHSESRNRDLPNMRKVVSCFLVLKEKITKYDIKMVDIPSEIRSLYVLNMEVFLCFFQVLPRIRLCRVRIDCFARIRTDYLPNGCIEWHTSALPQTLPYGYHQGAGRSAGWIEKHASAGDDVCFLILTCRNICFNGNIQN